MEIDPRAVILGTDRNRSWQGILVAMSLAVFVLLMSVLPLDAGAVVEPGLVIVGFGLASWWAYTNSGLAVSMLLVLAPVVTRLTYSWWLHLEQPAPVSLPLSFVGHGAWEMWVPLALLLGIIAFVSGAVIRRTHRLVSLQSRPGV